MMCSINAAGFGLLESATSSINHAALVAAIASLGDRGGAIEIPRGTYEVDAGIVLPHKNITIAGVGSALAYEECEAGTKLTFISTESNFGFELREKADGDYCCLRNMHINGNGWLDYGVKLRGGHLLDHMNVGGCAIAGIWLCDLVNQTHLSFVSADYNVPDSRREGDGYGLLIGSDSEGGYSNNTMLSIDGCTFRRNRVGVRIQNAAACSFTNTAIESNVEEGMQIYRPPNTNLKHLSFDSCHWESNDVEGSLVQLKVDAEDQADPASYLTFENCVFYGGDFEEEKRLAAMEIEAARVMNFTNCGGECNVALGPNAISVGFYNCEGLAIADNGKRNWIRSNDDVGTHTVTACDSGALTTVYVIEKSDQVRYFHVYAKIRGGTSDVDSYSAYALIAADSTSRVMHRVNGSRLTLSLHNPPGEPSEPGEIQIIQVSGARKEVEVFVAPIFPVVS